MKIVNFGSLNIDHVYRVPHFLGAGETLASTEYQVGAGGKGLNQSVALARAGANVLHAGKIGPEGRWLKEELEKAGVDISCIVEGGRPTGHAIIQVSPGGENCILLFGGANQDILSGEIDHVLSHTESGDILLLQNEINRLPEILEKAFTKGLRIALNPAPFGDNISELPLEYLTFLILNQIEGSAMTGTAHPATIVQRLVEKLPACGVILTLGAEGIIYHDANEHLLVPAEKVCAIDTTAAGDTFIGFFLAEISRREPPQNAIAVANRAAGICVTRIGAAASIPSWAEVQAGVS